MDALEIEKAVEQRRVWLDTQLDEAATALDVSVVGEPVNTFDMRSAGSSRPRPRRRDLAESRCAGQRL